MTVLLFLDLTTAETRGRVVAMENKPSYSTPYPASDITTRWIVILEVLGSSGPHDRKVTTAEFPSFTDSKAFFEWTKGGPGIARACWRLQDEQGYYTTLLEWDAEQ